MTSERQFEWAERHYRELMAAQTGRKSRDQKRREAKAKQSSQPFQPGRDPIRAGDSLEALLTDFQWNSKIERAELFLAWAEIVGPDSAAATVLEELANDTLIVRCRSTAWATQLRLLHDSILAKIQERFLDLGITEIRFLGPDAPSWKRGPRSVPGRGPRDTYG
jgi:predicted nucleic acid-binding Zn ribbon protein